MYRRRLIIVWLLTQRLCINFEEVVPFSLFIVQDYNVSAPGEWQTLQGHPWSGGA